MKRHNGRIEPPAPTLARPTSQQAYQQMRKAAIYQSAEGAGRLQEKLRFTRAPKARVGSNELVRPVRPKPSFGAGDGRQRSPVGLTGNGRQTTSIFDNCVSTSVRCPHYSLHPNRPNINSDRPRCRGDSITLRQATGHQMSEARVKRR